MSQEESNVKGETSDHSQLSLNSLCTVDSPRVPTVLDGNTSGHAVSEEHRSLL